MKKNTIRLTESQLKYVITESVKKVLKEQEGFLNYLDRLHQANNKANEFPENQRNSQEYKNAANDAEYLRKLLNDRYYEYPLSMYNELAQAYGIKNFDYERYKQVDDAYKANGKNYNNINDTEAVKWHKMMMPFIYQTKGDVFQKGLGAYGFRQEKQPNFLRQRINIWSGNPEKNVPGWKYDPNN